LIFGTEQLQVDRFGYRAMAKISWLRRIERLKFAE
jgi:hypothetical protein